jgi:hypothetical protein
MSAAEVKTRVPRPIRPAAPPLPAFDALDQTHRQMVEQLAALDELMTHLNEKGQDDITRDSARSICAFFENTARAHHADEERIVFPGLLASGDAELIALVQRLQQDHGWLEEDWIELALQLQAVAQGYSWYDLDSFLRRSTTTISDLRNRSFIRRQSATPPRRRRARGRA